MGWVAIAEWARTVAWGTVGEWVSGLGALGAVAVSLILYRRERAERLLAVEVADELREAEKVRQHREQAIGVSWVMEDAAEEVQLDEGTMKARLRIHNQSGRPIFNIGAAAVYKGMDECGGAVEVPVESTENMQSAGRAEIVHRVTLHGMEAVVWLLFTDAQGNQWARVEFGRLVDLGPGGVFPQYRNLDRLVLPWDGVDESMAEGEEFAPESERPE